MAPNFFSKIAIFVLILGLFAIPAPALAASRAELAPTNTHIVKFYLDPALVTDPEAVKLSLSKYVADMNTILAKNTNRQLAFDPATGLILTASKPHTDSARLPLPTEGFEIWVNARSTDRPFSHGGYAGVDISGAGVLAGLNWTRVYNPDALSGDAVKDYSFQLNNMLHELAHVFGAGIGEYYSLASVSDTTGVEPLLDINLTDPADAYWSDKPDFKTDPLLRITYSVSRADYLAAVQYSALTATVLNGSYRNGLPSLERYTVQVLDENDQPVAGANVKVWNMGSETSQLLNDILTDENGLVELEWGGIGHAHNNDNLLRLIKVYQDGVSLAQPRYLSIFDLDMAKFALGSAAHTVTFKSSPSAKVAIFTSAAAYDGFILEKNAKSNMGGSLNAKAATLRLGDDALNRQYKAILSFDTSSLPDDAIVTAVTLKIKQSGAPVGKNPFSTMGSLSVGLRSGAFGNANTLALKDFNAPASINQAGTFAKTPADNWYSAAIAENGLESINAAGVTQFRLSFTRADNNLRADYLNFFSGNNAGNAPQLEIIYILP
ncbi:MAG: hypothetical protein EHM81_06195 [Chloroflexi bacterium]|nr:MAG: hypothetical protein EHM81_06195 [Chloroflexota bacterium]